MPGSGERGDTDETIAAAHDVATMAAPGSRAIGEGATQLAEASSSRDTAGVGRTADPLSTGVRAIVERSREQDQTVGRERYRDGRLIGEGGMGRVLEAEDLQFGRLGESICEFGVSSQ